ncbi:MAG: hypothetical protein WBG24_14610, partial [Syntrophobacteria bacterium]
RLWHPRNDFAFTTRLFHSLEAQTRPPRLKAKPMAGRDRREMIFFICRETAANENHKPANWTGFARMAGLFSPRFARSPTLRAGSLLA